MRILRLLLIVTQLSACALAQDPAPPLTAEAIMARVAANQDRADAARAHFVYLQHAHVQSRKGNTVLCEEVTDMRVTPSPTGQSRQLLSLSGHVRKGSSAIHYTAFPRGASGAGSGISDENGDVGAHMSVGDKEIVLDADAGNAPVTVSDTDIDLVESMRQTFTSDSKNKDGINAGLFPLITDQQKDMVFDLKGREAKNGHDTFHIVFRPKDKSDYGWKGDAWIDTQAFEPVVVRTALSRSLPLGVRTLLGTNLPGLGFTVIYAPQADGVWFPVSFGTEFTIKVLFLWRRKMVVDVENRAFEQTHVSATVHTEAAKPVEPADPPQ